MRLQDAGKLLALSNKLANKKAGCVWLRGVYRGSSPLSKCEVPLYRDTLVSRERLTPRTSVELSAWSYCRVLGVDCFLSARYPCGGVPL